MSKFSINEIFGPSIQGEGLNAGIPSVFLRTSGCNLRCTFKNSICDTPYTSHRPEPPTITDSGEAVERVVELFKQNPGVTHLVITGGEPLLQWEGLRDFVQEFREVFPGHSITVETNGSMCPNDESELGDFLDMVDLISVSPKLSSSANFPEGTKNSVVEYHNKNRINPRALVNLIWTDNPIIKTQLKFVWSGPECEEEIKNLLGELTEVICEDMKNYDRDNKQSESPKRLTIKKCLEKMVMLMPEGETQEQLSTSAQSAVDCCIRNGWRYTDRVHIRIWGNRRAV